jgi:DNA-binding response OmpR family regulator
MRLLLVEDSVALADELMPRLKQAGYAVDWLADGRDASRRAGEEN